MKKRPEFYRAEELAQILCVNVMTIYRYIKAGKVNAYKIGKEFRIARKEFEKLLMKARTRQDQRRKSRVYRGFI
jgi:excisionase family DNA binding protein